MPVFTIRIVDGDKTTDHNVSADNLLIGLMNMVASLTHRLTGCTPLLCIDDDKGGKQHFLPDYGGCTLIPRGGDPMCPVCNSAIPSVNGTAAAPVKDRPTLP